MIKAKENADIFLKYLNWGLIFLAFAILGCAKLFAIGGFSEPLDAHFHVDLDHNSLINEFDGEKWLQENCSSSSDNDTTAETYESSDEGVTDD